MRPALARAVTQMDQEVHEGERPATEAEEVQEPLEATSVPPFHGRRRDSRSRSDSRDSTSGSSSDSLVPPLQKKAAREPGSVLRMLLSRMFGDALAEAAVPEGRL